MAQPRPQVSAEADHAPTQWSVRSPARGAPHHHRTSRANLHLHAQPACHPKRRRSVPSHDQPCPGTHTAGGARSHPPNQQTANTS
eukprot:4437718-Prymnesium_polylepis.1